MLKITIQKMTQRIAEILERNIPAIYLYGSVTLDDFKIGWSDIDILVLTEHKISEAQAQKLVTLRQAMLEEDPENQYYRLFEGGMLTTNALRLGTTDRVVYWGTSGERIDDHYSFDAFCMSELLDTGILLYGNDVRAGFAHPGFDELKGNVRRHYETIRKYAKASGRSLYTYGWLLDISRCIYTLRTGKVIAKTAAGEWALRENLCPCEAALTKAVKIRNNPAVYKNNIEIFDYAETMDKEIQRYADVLEKELKRKNEEGLI